MLVAPQGRSVCVRACVMPSVELKVTSNMLVFFNDKSSIEGWRVSWAQVVRVLSPGFLPWILPNRETLAFSAHVVRSKASKFLGTLITTLRSMSCVTPLFDWSVMTPGGGESLCFRESCEGSVNRVR